MATETVTKCDLCGKAGAEAHTATLSTGSTDSLKWEKDLCGRCAKRAEKFIDRAMTAPKKREAKAAEEKA